MELLELAALRAGVEPKPGVRGKATLGGLVLAPALREGSVIATPTKARTGGGVSPASLTNRAEEARLAGGIRAAGHGDGVATGNRR
jgi:hypothetical protein